MVAGKTTKSSNPTIGKDDLTEFILNNLVGLKNRFLLPLCVTSSPIAKAIRLRSFLNWK